MEFWGVEVKAGQPIKCNPGLDGKYLHLSQASLGEVKKDKSDSVPIFVKIGEQKLVLGTLSAERCPQISFDLVFEKEFELSHNWKQGSVYFCGYFTTPFDEEPEGFTESDSEEEDHALLANENGKNDAKVEKAKPAAVKAASKPQSAENAKVKADAKKPNDQDDDEDDSDDFDDSEDDSDADLDDDDEDMLDAADSDDDDDEDDDDDSDDESSDEDEATPKAEVGKKRPAESAKKTPASDKKAKLSTPSGQKSGGGDGKKGQVTPQPSKATPQQKGGKTPTNDKSKQQTPKSAGQVACKSCNKSFNSDKALESHTKAKHSAK